MQKNRFQNFHYRRLFFSLKVHEQKSVVKNFHVWTNVSSQVSRSNTILVLIQKSEGILKDLGFDKRGAIKWWLRKHIHIYWSQLRQTIWTFFPLQLPTPSVCPFSFTFCLILSLTLFISVSVFFSSADNNIQIILNFNDRRKSSTSVSNLKFSSFFYASWSLFHSSPWNHLRFTIDSVEHLRSIVR